MHAILRLSHNNRSLASHFLFDTCNFDKFTKDRFLTRDLDQQYGHYAQTGQIPDCCDPTVLPYRSPARSKWMMAIKSAIGNTSTSPLLRLPRELFIQILDHLPFSSKLILQRQVCRTLRDAISVGLDLPSRLSLPSLLLARKDVREISQGIRQEHENAQDELITETLPHVRAERREIQRHEQDRRDALRLNHQQAQADGLARQSSRASTRSGKRAVRASSEEAPVSSAERRPLSRKTSTNQSQPSSGSTDSEGLPVLDRLRGMLSTPSRKALFEE